MSRGLFTQQMVVSLLVQVVLQSHHVPRIVYPTNGRIHTPLRCLPTAKPRPPLEAGLLLVVCYPSLHPVSPVIIVSVVTLTVGILHDVLSVGRGGVGLVDSHRACVKVTTSTTSVCGVRQWVTSRKITGTQLA